MKIALVACLLASCGHLAHVERVRNNPSTWEEACIQREMLCLSDSTAGGVVVPILAPVVVFMANERSPTVILRHCKLQGDLCRARIPRKPTPASTPAESD